MSYIVRGNSLNLLGVLVVYTHCLKLESMTSQGRSPKNFMSTAEVWFPRFHAVYNEMIVLSPREYVPHKFG